MGATERAKQEPEEVGLHEASDIINALQNIMANSRMKIPDLETPYSTLPNSAIAPHDHSIIGAIITKRRQQLEAISHDISSAMPLINEIQNFFLQLLENRKRIAYSLDLHEGRASTVWCLPNEVLSQIFVYCLPVETAYLWPASVEDPPTLLTKICRRWRDVAVNLPSLWCGLCVDPRVAHRSYETWLQRSRGRPLSLCIERQASDSLILQSLSNPQSPLRPYLKQVSSLQVGDCRSIAPLIEDLSSIQELVISDLSGLEKVDLGVLGRLLLRHTSSTLRSLKFTRENPTMLKKLHHFHPLLAHLADFDLIVDEPAFGPLFELGCNLSSLTIRSSSSFDKSYSNYPGTGCWGPHTHAKLQSLHIIDSCGSKRSTSFPILFGSLTLPNLCKLKVSHRNVPTRCHVALRRWFHGPHEEFKAFLTRSKCPLRRLVLCSCLGVTDEQIAEYRALVPSLFEVIILLDCWRPRPC